MALGMNTYRGSSVPVFVTSAGASQRGDDSRREYCLVIQHLRHSALRFGDIRTEQVQNGNDG